VSKALSALRGVLRKAMHLGLMSADDCAPIYEILGRIAERACVDAFSPHEMRRSFISELLDAGADVAVVAQMAGHAQITTTAKYDRRGERAKLRAASLRHMPFCKSVKGQPVPGLRAWREERQGPRALAVRLPSVARAPRRGTTPLPSTLFMLVGGRWSEAQVYRGAERVRAVPFDAIDLDLALLWAR
jgi:Phage integrase family